MTPSAAAPHSADLAFTLDLDAPAARVYAALTEARELERWLCDRAVSEPVTLGRLSLAWTGAGATAEPYEGRWTLVDPPRACVHEGGSAAYPRGYSGRVRCALAAGPRGTRLEVVHQFPAHDAWAPFVARHREAWPRALERLARHLGSEDAP